MKTAFSRLTLKGATHLQKGLQTAFESGYLVVVFSGTWLGRRFMATGAKVASSMPDTPVDIAGEKLAVLTTLDPSALKRAFNSFGQAVERARRDSVRGQFDHVVSGDDGQRHLVHRYHHIGLCGHKPSAWLSDSEVNTLAIEVQPCAKCAITAATKPRHRARYHPLAANDGMAAAA